MKPERIFLLAPARCGGRRAQMLFREDDGIELARRLVITGGRGQMLPSTPVTLSDISLFCEVPIDLADAVSARHACAGQPRLLNVFPAGSVC